MRQLWTRNLKFRTTTNSDEVHLTGVQHKWSRIIIFVLWVCALAFAIRLALHRSWTGWDTHVYTTAMRYLAESKDPYAEGVAAQRAHLAAYSYPYSPITLPLLRVFNRVPFRWLTVGYVSIYLASFFFITQLGLFAARERERQLLLLLAPGAFLFPGLIRSIPLFLSGNIAVILYTTVLAGAVLGWKKGSWTPFYLAVLIASCVKAPMLSLVAIAALSDRKQWVKSLTVAMLGIGLFAGQSLLFPSTFRSYLTAVQLQFDLNGDFGLSPAGLLARYLFLRGLPFSLPSSLCFGVYALLCAVILLLLARRFFADGFSREEWIPVLLTGVFLLNPRVKEYDMFALTLPMALILMRVASDRVGHLRGLLDATVLFLFFNLLGLERNLGYKATCGILLPLLFVAGSARLFWSSSQRATFRGDEADLRVPSLSC